MNVQRLDKPSDKLINSRYEFNGAVIGMLLGDGYLRKYVKSKGPSNRHKSGPFWNKTTLYLKHAADQKDYLIWKASLISDYVDSISYKVLEGGLKKFSNGEYFCQDSYTASIKSFKGFHYLFNKFYKFCKLNEKSRYLYGCKKIVTSNTLNRLTPLGLAIWYMDDGTLHYRKRKNTEWYQLALSTQCFDESEHKIMQEYFINKYGIYFNIYQQSHKYFLLSTEKFDNVVKFINIVKPYVSMIDCMQYKILGF